MTTREQLQDTLYNRLFWHTAERDDAKVADHIFHRREMDVAYSMDETTLFVPLFNYLQEIEVFLFLTSSLEAGRASFLTVQQENKLLPTFSLLCHECGCLQLYSPN